MAVKMAQTKLQHSCEIELELTQDDKLYFNEGQFNQVILNLVINSSHAVGEDGRIWIHTHRDDDWMVIEVGDNGPGIPAHHQKQIFDPFFTTTEVGEGTGLGLSIVHGIIEGHLGEIDLKSSETEGTVFTIKLPVRAQY